MQKLVKPDGTVLERFVTDPEGIEIFNTVDGPIGEPTKIEEFPKATREEVERRIGRMNKQDAADTRAELEALRKQDADAKAAKAKAAKAAAARSKRGADSSDDEEMCQECEVDDDEPPEIEPSRAKVEMRMDPAVVLENVNGIIEGFPSHFRDAEAAKAWWAKWAQEAPVRVADVPPALRPVWQWPSSCPDEATPPSASALASAYNESIAYVNAVGGSKFTVAQMADVDAEQRDVDLSKIEAGEFLFVLAPENADGFPDELRGGEAQWNTPIWLCQAEAQSYATESDPNPTVQISWWASAPCKHGRMAGAWFPMCVGGHKLVPGCRGNNHGKWLSEIQRAHIRVTGVGLNAQLKDHTRTIQARKKLSSRAQVSLSSNSIRSALPALASPLLTPARSNLRPTRTAGASPRINAQARRQRSIHVAAAGERAPAGAK